MMAALSSDWLIFFVPAAVQGARTQGSTETPAASQCNLGQPVYCTHVCLSSYVHLEHKGTSFVLWETPPHIPARTLPQVRWLGTAKKASQRSRRSVPGSAPAALWGVSKAAYCLSALVHLPVKQAVHIKTSCVSQGIYGCDFPEVSYTLGVPGGRDAYILYIHAQHTYAEH